MRRTRARASAVACSRCPRQRSVGSKVWFPVHQPVPRYAYGAAPRYAIGSTGLRHTRGTGTPGHYYDVRTAQYQDSPTGEWAWLWPAPRTPAGHGRAAVAPTFPQIVISLQTWARPPDMDSLCVVPYASGPLRSGAVQALSRRLQLAPTTHENPVHCNDCNGGAHEEGRRGGGQDRWSTAQPAARGRSRSPG